MKKSILVLVLVSSMLVNTAYAGDRHGGGINPLWVPVAILSTLAAVTIASPPPVVYERSVYYEPRHTVVYEEPRRTVVYEEPRHYRHDRYYERGPSYGYRENHGYSPRYRDYR